MRRVYIGKFNHHVRERDVERFFRSEGKIREVLMKDGFAFVEFEHTEDAENAVRRLDGRDLDGDRVHVEFAKGPPKGREPIRGGLGMSRGPPRNGPPRGDYRSDGRDTRDSRDARDMRDMRDTRDRRGLVRDGGRDDRDRGDTYNSGRSAISYAERYGPPRNTEYRVIVENLSSRVSWQDLKDLMRRAGEVTFADAHKRERNMGIVDFASLKDMRNAIQTLSDTEFHGRRIKVYEDKSRRRGGGDSGGSGRDSGGRRSGRRSRSRSPRRYSRSRSPSSGRASESRSRSTSITRDRDAPSRSRSRTRSRSHERAPLPKSRSRSPIVRDSEHASHSRSRSPERPAASRSRSPEARDDAPSRSRSASSSPKASREPERSRSKTRSRSRDSHQLEERESNSPARSESAHSDQKDSRSRSNSRSNSGSPSTSGEDN